MQPPSFRVLYEDADYLVVEKDAGLPVLSERWEPEAVNLLTLLQTARPNVVTAHRIDKETSGIVLCAQHGEAARFLEQAFRLGTVEKEYTALAHGLMPQGNSSCTLPLRIDANRKHQTLVDEKHGIQAHTDFLLVKRFYNCSLLTAKPRTGRTHQIRVHAQAMGFPLIGDELYGGKDLYLSRIKRSYRGDTSEERPLMARVALHASRLAFTAIDGSVKNFESALPQDFVRTIKQLERC